MSQFHARDDVTVLPFREMHEHVFHCLENYWIWDFKSSYNVYSPCFELNWIVFVVWLTDERCFSLISSRHHYQRSLSCSEPEFRLWWIKLCRSDISTTPRLHGIWGSNALKCYNQRFERRSSDRLNVSQTYVTLKQLLLFFINFTTFFVGCILWWIATVF